MEIWSFISNLFSHNLWINISAQYSVSLTWLTADSGANKYVWNMLSQNNIFMMENNENANEDCSSFTKRKLVKCGVIKIIGFGTSCFMKIKKGPKNK